ncbi:helix-turn-helix transcriptional regulator [Heyndrickxia coagulans]|uniref:helix-turn-helix transcriptional regulator n=1 Tax=Heyndrickxia coagulans TaxID=1398 RepID=UPI00223594AF|nr:helix-turn-helix transcriptional regulator [Heyndrickxia coagulans]UZH06370.1 helix-turn-helix transcriptional regulator [Heyndrickxia coagulans]
MTSQELQLFLISKREELQLTQQDVAEQTGYIITRQYYGMIENGERRPSVEVAKAIAKVLKIKWTIFFEINSNQKLREKSREVS